MHSRVVENNQFIEIEDDISYGTTKFNHVRNELYESRTKPARHICVRLENITDKSSTYIHF